MARPRRFSPVLDILTDFPYDPDGAAVVGHAPRALQGTIAERRTSTSLVERPQASERVPRLHVSMIVFLHHVFQIVQLRVDVHGPLVIVLPSESLGIFIDSLEVPGMTEQIGNQRRTFPPVICQAQSGIEILHRLLVPGRPPLIITKDKGKY